jgi:hypothetical protein
MSTLRHFFKRVLLPERPERPLHELDRRLAKEWIKKRLAVIYPELRGDPERLEEAYRELGLESTGMVRRPDGEVPSFRVQLPGTVARPFDQP